jgi:hypothetical protein
MNRCLEEVKRFGGFTILDRGSLSFLYFLPLCLLRYSKYNLMRNGTSYQFFNVVTLVLSLFSRSQRVRTTQYAVKLCVLHTYPLRP